MAVRFLLNEEVFLPNVSKQIIDLSSYILAYFMRNVDCASEDDIPAFIHQLIVQALDSCPLGMFENIVSGFYILLSMLIISSINGLLRKHSKRYRV